MKFLWSGILFIFFSSLALAEVIRRDGTARDSSLDYGSEIENSQWGSGGHGGHGGPGAPWGHGGRAISPKVFIVDLYDQEGESWYGISAFNLLAHNITVPGLSPIFPDVHCTADFAICQIIAGEGEINAATSLTALTFSPLFNLRHTYFLITGVAGVNPKVATTASVAFARFAIQVSLQYEWDIRELPDNFTTGYVPQGSTAPDQYPQEIYGTEVFELNRDLRDHAIGLVNSANVMLNDTQEAAQYRSLFLNGSKEYAAGAQAPSVVACDSVTSDVYFSGQLLNDAFDNYTTLVTNGTGRYCSAQQEDNAVLEPLLRGQLANKTDFSRVMIMRTASDFVPPPPGISAFDNLEYGQSGYVPALANIPIAGVPVVTGIVKQWDTLYRQGIKPSNYIGDILGTLGGVPDYGPGPIQEPEPLSPLNKRGLRSTRDLLQGRMRKRFAHKAKLLPRMRVSGD